MKKKIAKRRSHEARLLKRKMRMRLQSAAVMYVIILAGFIPNAEDGFNDWQDNFMGKVPSYLAGWGVDPLLFDPLIDLQPVWVSAFTKGRKNAKPNATQVQAKNDVRKVFEKELRKFIRQWITGNPLVTNEQRQDIGVTVPDSTRSAMPVPTATPKGTVDKMDHLIHVLRIVDAATPLSRAKPKGVSGTQVYRFIGTVAPTDLAQYSFIGNASRFLYKSVFSDGDVGKTAWYYFMYQNAKGQTGPEERDCECWDCVSRAADVKQEAASV